MDNGFIAADFEVSPQELAEMTDEQRKWAGMTCEYADDWSFWVQSKTDKTQWYKVQHDDVSVIKCQCMWAKCHKGFCKSHFFRAGLALKKRNARLEKIQAAPKPVVLNDRLGNYLTRTPGFNFYR